MVKSATYVLVVLLCFSCTRDTPNRVYWDHFLFENGKYTGFNIPNYELPNDYNPKLIKIYLSENQRNVSIFGNISLTDSSLIFRTLAPLSYGMSYKVTYHDILVNELKFDRDLEPSTELLGIYPSADTLPENLLKFYFHFSQPMSQTHSLEKLLVLSDEDTIQPFLDLPSELWNLDRTVLTLWLDPGRIKRELVPNRESGNPLIKGKSYRLIVPPSWNDAQGLPLIEGYEKAFYVDERDDELPVPQNWKLIIPKVNSMDPLLIDFHEPLDYSLLQESFVIINSDSTKMEGEFELMTNEKLLKFSPLNNWKTGEYNILIKTKLEDLSGNNLNRPFDRDMTKVEVTNELPFVSLGFEIGD